MGKNRATGSVPVSDNHTGQEGGTLPDTGATEAPQEIVLLGGSGDVGTRLSRLLLENSNATVTTVSRRKNKDSDQFGGRLRHVSYDLSQPDMLDTPANALVINLTEVTPPTYAKQVISAGGWWLESSATPAYLGAIEAVLADISSSGTAILGVGAAPGLTNLLAAEILAKSPDTAQIDIGVEMGMGRHYGAAATEWFLGAAGKPYPVIIDRNLTEVKPGDLKRRFSFREGGPLRRAIGYGFAEQKLIAERSEKRLKTVRSFVAVDPAWMTGSLALMLGIGLGPAIGRNARKIAKWMLRTPALGQAHTRLIAEGFDETGRMTGRVRVETGDQAEATAAIILAVFLKALTDRGASQPSVTAITDHLSLEAALEVLHRALPETRFSHSFVDKSGEAAGPSK